jgi:hypothetical protein
MKKFFPIALVLGVVFVVVAGCGEADAPSTTPTQGGGSDAPKATAGGGGIQGAPTPSPTPQGG